MTCIWITLKTKKNDNNNTCNDSTPKRLKSEHGKTIISVPRDRDGSFEPIVVSRHQSRAVSVENMVISLYTKVLSISETEQKLDELYGNNLPISSI